MSEPSFRVAEANEFKELVQLLLKLMETARQIPDGAERQSAFRMIDSFQSRLVQLIKRSESPGIAGSSSQASGRRGVGAG